MLQKFFCLVVAVIQIEPTDEGHGDERQMKHRRVEHLARENMKLHSKVNMLQEELAAARQATASSSSSSSRPSTVPRAKAKGKPIQAGMYPAENENVARFKVQSCSKEERERRDARNAKVKRHLPLNGSMHPCAVDSADGRSMYIDKHGAPASAQRPEQQRTSPGAAPGASAQPRTHTHTRAHALCERRLGVFAAQTPRSA